MVFRSAFLSLSSFSQLSFRYKFSILVQRDHTKPRTPETSIQVQGLNRISFKARPELSTLEVLPALATLELEWQEKVLLMHSTVNSSFIDLEQTLAGFVHGWCHVEFKICWTSKNRTKMKFLNLLRNTEAPKTIKITVPRRHPRTLPQVDRFHRGLSWKSQCAFLLTD